MRCSKAQEMIILKLDKELKARYSVSLEKHLAVCADCRLYREEMGKQNARFTELSAPQYPSWLHHRILAQANEHDSLRRHSRMMLQLQKIPALIAILLSLYIGTLVGIKTNSSATAGTQEYSETTSTTALASFGENSIVDDSYYNGGYNE